MSVWVKICGVRTVADALVAVEAGADALGLNFYPPSARFCSDDEACAIVASLPRDFPCYGVFVDRGREEILATIRATGINGVQLHGRESVADALGWGVPVLRAISLQGPPGSEDGTAVFPPAAGVGSSGGEPSPIRMLLDSPRGGGSGTRIPEEYLLARDLSGSVLAGGLTPDNVADTIRRWKPWGVDTAGGVERARGVKCPARIREFVHNAKNAAD